MAEGLRWRRGGIFGIAVTANRAATAGGTALGSWPLTERDGRPPLCPLALTVCVEVRDFRGVREGMTTGCEWGGMLAVAGIGGLWFSLLIPFVLSAICVVVCIAVGVVVGVVVVVVCVCVCVFVFEGSDLVALAVGLVRAVLGAIFSERRSEEGEDGWR